MSNTIEQGQEVETRISEWLCAQGLIFIQRNYRRRIGEIDLIMRESDSGIIVFVEVRYRENNCFGGALASVDARKQKKLLRTASAWLQQHADDRTNARFDVIAVSRDAGEPKRSQCSAEPQVICWQGWNIIWIRNALETN